jgi:hypothetical protein
MFKIQKLLASATFNTIFRNKRKSIEVNVHTDHGDIKLPQNHQITKLANVPGASITEQTVTDLVNGGTYFVKENEAVIDFRDNRYRGYIMNQSTLDQFTTNLESDVVTSGFQKGMMLHKRNSEELLIRMTDHRDEHLETTGLIAYSPFDKDVYANYEIERLWCANGCTTQHPILNRRAPVINMPVDNMGIIFDQMSIQLENVMTKRLNEMRGSAVSIADMMKLHGMILSRMNDSNTIAPIISRTLPMLDVKNNELLTSALISDVFEDSSLAAQTKGNITEYVLWNLITQVMTHSKGSEFSNKDFDVFASDILFDGSDIKKYRQMSSAPNVELYDSTANAFYGKG